MDKNLDFKEGGLIKECRGELFTIRLRLPGGVVQGKQLVKLSQIAERWGEGFVHLTARQSVEIPGIDFGDLGQAKAALEKAGMPPGSCGPRIRNVLGCPGTVSCKHGLVDSRALALELDRRFLGHDYPVKIKMAVAGCPNSCTKPQINDIGFVGMADPELNVDLCNGCGLCVNLCKEGAIVMRDGIPQRDSAKCIYCGDCMIACPTGARVAGKTGYAFYVGGKMGRKPRLGQKLAEFVPPEQAPELVAGYLEFVEKHGKQGERSGALLDRMGLPSLKKHLQISG